MTPREEFEALLVRAKSLERADDLSVLAPLFGPQGVLYVSVLAHWPSVRMPFVATNNVTTCDDWRRLWGFVQVCITDIRRIAGLQKTALARDVAEELISLRAVYPDGTVPDLWARTVRSIMTRKVRALMPAKQRGGE